MWQGKEDCEIYQVKTEMPAKSVPLPWKIKEKSKCLRVHRNCDVKMCVCVCVCTPAHLFLLLKCYFSVSTVWFWMWCLLKETGLHVTVLLMHRKASYSMFLLFDSPQLALQHSTSISHNIKTSYQFQCCGWLVHGSPVSYHSTDFLWYSLTGKIYNCTDTWTC